MKNLSLTQWDLSEDMLPADFYTEESEADLSAENFSWETNPITLLEELEEGWDDVEDDLDGMF